MTNSKPNILWICTDEQRFDTLGCYGNPYVLTTNIDQLAKKGTVVEHAFVQCPVCTPSRSSFLTGRYPRTTRNRQNGQSLSESEVLFPKILREHGYYTGLIGKLHLSPCEPEVSPFGEPRIDDGYVEFHWSNSPNPKWMNNEYNRWLARKGQTFHTEPYRDSKYVLKGMPAESHQTHWEAETAIHFIKAAEKYDRPWMLSLNPMDPHFPFDPPLEYLERYLDFIEDIPLPNYQPGELENKPSVQKTDHAMATNKPGRFPFHEMSDQDQRLIRAAYWAMVDQIDFEVGRVIETLEQTGQMDNTIIIFMSDHGHMLGDHGIHLKGPYFYEGLVRVPLIITGPEIKSEQRTSALVELVDLAPTLLEAIGIPVLPAMQGKSFWNILTGEENAHHRSDVYSEFYNATWRTWDRDPGQSVNKYENKEDKNAQSYATMLRTQDHKIVVYHGEPFGELYDLQNDPAETYNQWSDPAYQTKKMALLQRLCDRMAWTCDPLPLRISRW